MVHKDQRKMPGRCCLHINLRVSLFWLCFSNCFGTLTLTIIISDSWLGVMVGLGKGQRITAVGGSSGSDQVLLGQQQTGRRMEAAWGHTVLLQRVHEAVQVVFCVVLLLVP